ncbi:MAG: YaiI/YqxD family protein [Alphaproteobacteria bacterium]
MFSIYVDGDACPVKDEVVRVAARYSLQVTIVSNQGLRSNMGPHVRGVLVGPEFDAADNWIVDHLAADDIVITSDIQLAARCLKKAAQALTPAGKIFTDENIGSSLAMRELSSYLREAGEIKGNNPSFSKQDRSSFLQALDKIIQKNNRPKI